MPQQVKDNPNAKFESATGEGLKTPQQEGQAAGKRPSLTPEAKALAGTKAKQKEVRGRMTSFIDQKSTALDLLKQALQTKQQQVAPFAEAKRGVREELLTISPEQFAGLSPEAAIQAASDKISRARANLQYIKDQESSAQLTIDNTISQVRGMFEDQLTKMGLKMEDLGLRRQEEFAELEAQKSRKFQRREGERARMFQSEQERLAEESQGRRDIVSLAFDPTVLEGGVMPKDLPEEYRTAWEGAAKAKKEEITFDRKPKGSGAAPSYSIQKVSGYGRAMEFEEWIAKKGQELGQSIDATDPYWYQQYEIEVPEEYGTFQYAYNPKTLETYPMGFLRGAEPASAVTLIQTPQGTVPIQESELQPGQPIPGTAPVKTFEDIIDERLRQNLEGTQF